MNSVRGQQRLDTGQVPYRAGEKRCAIWVVSAGAIKTCELDVDDQEQVVGFHPDGRRHGLNAEARERARIQINSLKAELPEVDLVVSTRRQALHVPFGGSVSISRRVCRKRGHCNTQLMDATRKGSYKTSACMG